MSEQTKEPKSGAELIAEERLRQTQVEGWTAEHDDEHSGGEMVSAAVCYAVHAQGRAWIVANNPRPDLGDGLKRYRGEEPPMGCDWPWDDEWWKPQDPIRDLVRAGALIAAEIDRLQRAAPTGA